MEVSLNDLSIFKSPFRNFFPWIFLFSKIIKMDEFWMRWTWEFSIIQSEKMKSLNSYRPAQTMVLTLVASSPLFFLSSSFHRHMGLESCVVSLITSIEMSILHQKCLETYKTYQTSIPKHKVNIVVYVTI